MTHWGFQTAQGIASEGPTGASPRTPCEDQGDRTGAPPPELRGCALIGAIGGDHLYEGPWHREATECRELSSNAHFADCDVIEGSEK